jgi:hypothetical protein
LEIEMRKLCKILPIGAFLLIFLQDAELSAQGMEGTFAIDYGSVMINTPQNLVREVDPSPETIYNIRSNSPISQSLNFTPNAAQRSKNITAYIDRLAEVDPNGAKVIEAQLRTPGFFDNYGQMLRGVGLNPNGLADNMAAWWVTAWEASTGRDVETPTAAFPKVKLQAGRALGSAVLSKMTNAQKQEMADGLAIQSVILAANLDHAKNNPAYRKQLAEQVKKMAMGLKLDLGAMTLTSEGFRPKGKKRSDASDVAGEEQALASNDAAAPVPSDDSEGWSTAQIALIAAAGGAGIAGVFAIGKASGKKG